jgi:hypothetical protein
MTRSARDALQLLAENCEKLADAMPGNLEETLRRVPHASEREKLFLAGYCEGHIKAYRGIAEDLRKIVRESPSSTVVWPRIGIGIGVLWPVGGSN